MQLRLALKAAGMRIPAIRDLVTQRDRLIVERDSLAHELDEVLKHHRFVPPGHFYSPLPSLEEVSRDAGRIYVDLSRIALSDG